MPPISGISCSVWALNVEGIIFCHPLPHECYLSPKNQAEISLVAAIVVSALNQTCRHATCRLRCIAAKFHPATFFTFSRLKKPVPRPPKSEQNWRRNATTRHDRPSTITRAMPRHPRGVSHPKHQNLTVWIILKISKENSLMQWLYISFYYFIWPSSLQD